MKMGLDFDEEFHLGVQASVGIENERKKGESEDCRLYLSIRRMM